MGRTLLIISLMTTWLGINPPEDDPAGSKSLFLPPVHFAMYLSANFMELRTDHFHSGLDVKTQGVTGKRVYAIDKGYIARIKISTSGFGKAIYIKHPSGYTSVYGHLSHIADKFMGPVRETQYRKQSYVVDLFFSPDEIPVHRGEFIGFSGNTGNSFGPHLHFEIRDSQTEHPVNPLKFRFPVKDTIPPVFYSLIVYPQTAGVFIDNMPVKKRIKLIKDQEGYIPEQSKPVMVTGPVSLGFEVQDYFNRSHNRCGIYDLQVSVDGRLFYHVSMDEFSYGTTRYINTFMDYAEKIDQGRNIIRTYVAPNNRLHLYRTVENHGILQFDDMSPHMIEVMASDINGNRSYSRFSIQHVTPPVKGYDLSEPNGQKMVWNTKNYFSDGQMDVTIPPLALYDTIYFQYKVLPYQKNSLSPVFQIHTKDVPLQRPITLEIKPDSVALRYASKLLLAMVDEKGNLSAAGGSLEDGKVSGAISKFGNYTVTLDTIPPVITPLFRDDQNDFRKVNSIRFKIKDDFSGIKSYNGFIDDAWVLFEYEPKSETIWYRFDPGRLDRGKQHSLTLKVVDGVDNVTEYDTMFFW